MKLSDILCFVSVALGLATISALMSQQILIGTMLFASSVISAYFMIKRMEDEEK